MFAESMFSPPRDDAKPRAEEGLTVWPALAAVAFAWLIALVRLFLGQARHEKPGPDLVLAAGAIVFIPVTVLLVWRIAGRARNGARARIAVPERRRHLALVPPLRSSMRVEASVGRGGK